MADEKLDTFFAQKQAILESGQKPNQEEVILKFFNYTHLPKHLQEVSRPFHDLAHRIVETLPRNAERSVALRKLLESKDAAVRTMVE